MTAVLGCGFTYDLAVKHKADGHLLDIEHGRKNRVPMEGLNDMATAYLKGGAGPAALYIGLWSGALIPTGQETAATLLQTVTEVQGYSQTGRLPLVLGSVVDGAVSNTAALARFDMTAGATVNGVFLSTVQAKAATTGKLVSVVRFANPRVVDSSMYLEVLTGFQFVSL